ncbi:MAG: MurR/RpiR family transcriptional regulator [bacterium]
MTRFDRAMTPVEQIEADNDGTPAPLCASGADADAHGFLRARLTELHSRLSPQQRRAAEVVRDKSDEVANYSLRRVARHYNIAPSHFSRLARTIGYSDYEALRNACRSGVRARRLTFAQKAAALRDKSLSAQSGSFVVRYGAESINNIEAMLNEIDPSALDAVAESLATARRVFLAGNLSSANLIAHMQYMADIAFDNWHTIHASAFGKLTHLRADDAVLVLGYAPYARDSVDMARMVANAGADLVAVTDDNASPLAEFSRHVICLPTDSTQFFPSYVPALVFLEALMAMVVCRSSAAVRGHIDAAETHRYNTGQYWADSFHPSNRRTQP